MYIYIYVCMYVCMYIEREIEMITIIMSERYDTT